MREGFAALALHRPSRPENIGGVFRAADVYGVKLVVLGGGELPPEPLGHPGLSLPLECGLDVSLRMETAVRCGYGARLKSSTASTGIGGAMRHTPKIIPSRTRKTTIWNSSHQREQWREGVQQVLAWYRHRARGMSCGPAAPRRVPGLRSEPADPTGEEQDGCLELAAAPRSVRKPPSSLPARGSPGYGRNADCGPPGVFRRR